MVRSEWRGRFSKIPYRLPELLSSDPAQVVFVPEGEKDVDRLWHAGLIATCNAFGGGRGTSTQGHSRYLRRRDVVILPDNDQTGRKHAMDSAEPRSYCPPIPRTEPP